MAKRITIKDIARELNTNSSTVSRALNDSPLISEETRALVKKKAVEMGYYPNPIAIQLRKGKSRTFGMLVPFINRVFFANVIHGVESLAKKKGYQLLIIQSNDSVEEERDAIRTLRAQKVAGIIVSKASGDTSDSFYEEVLSDGIPLVMFDRVSKTLNANKVVNANREASYEVVRHLIEQGYRRIVHFGGPMSLSMYQERYTGYCQALEEAGIGVDPDLVFHPAISLEAGKELTRKILAKKLDFDAVAAASDFSGLGALLTMREMGIAVPEEKGIVGFSNEYFTELVGMSSVEQFSVDMGKTIARILFEEIEESEGKESRTPRIHHQVVITPKLVLRASSQRKESGFRDKARNV